MTVGPDQLPRSLQFTLTRGLLVIAALVILANILVVAYFETANRNDLILELTRREALRLERAWLDADADPARALEEETGIYHQFPDAYAAGFFAPDGSMIAGRNIGSFPTTCWTEARLQATGSIGQQGLGISPSFLRMRSWVGSVGSGRVLHEGRSGASCP